MDKVTLIYNTRRILVTLAITGISGFNLPMNDKNFKVYKGSTNSIEIVVKNNDRKPVDLTGYQLIISISNPETHQIIYQQPLTTNNAAQGTTTLTLTDEITDDWPFGTLRYVVLMQNLTDLSQQILYTTQDEGGSGYLEVLEGPDIGPVASQTSTTFTLEDTGNVLTTYYYSDIFFGNAQVNKHDFGAITMCFYMTNWTGQIFIQGNIEDATPSDNSSWFLIITNMNIINSMDVSSIPVVSYTGILPVTFEASLRWVRVLLLPDPNNHGTFDEIMMRT